MAKIDQHKIDTILANLQDRLSSVERLLREEMDGQAHQVGWDAGAICDVVWTVWHTRLESGKLKVFGWGDGGVTVSPQEPEPGVQYEAWIDDEELEITVSVERGLRSAKTKNTYLRREADYKDIVEWERELQSMYRHCVLQIGQQRRREADRLEGQR